MSRVVIVQRRLTHYRVPFFEGLAESLGRHRIDLEVITGQGRANERAKADTATLSWAVGVPTRYFLRQRACWMNLGGRLSGADLVIGTHENQQLHILYALARSKLVGGKFAFWGHGANLQSKKPTGTLESIKRFTAALPDWWFAYTNLSGQYVQNAGFPADRITVVQNAVDTRALAVDVRSRSKEAARAHLKLPNDAVVGLYLGSLYEDKRLNILFAAFDLIRQRLPSFQLLIAGDGPMRDYVQQECAARRGCCWIGAQHGMEKATCLRSADVILNPGSIGLGVLDSFVAKVPLVTADIFGHGPEIDYLRNEKNGLIVGRDPSDFARGVLAVVNDQEIRQRIVSGCELAANVYTLDVMVRNFTSGIRQCIDLE